mgnify:CR=1 FL=1
MRCARDRHLRQLNAALAVQFDQLAEHAQLMLSYDRLSKQQTVLRAVVGEPATAIQALAAAQLRRDLRATYDRLLQAQQGPAMRLGHALSLYDRLDRKHERHSELIAACRRNSDRAAAHELHLLATDHLRTARQSSGRRRCKQRPATQLGDRRAACVGTSAATAPPVVVGATATAAQLGAASVTGVSPPM